MYTVHKFVQNTTFGDTKNALNYSCWSKPLMSVTIIAQHHMHTVSNVLNALNSNWLLCDLTVAGVDSLVFVLAQVKFY